jgi:hypothetical protein
MRLPRGDNDPADGNSLHAAGIQSFHKVGRWLFGQNRFFAIGRVIKERAVFGDDPVKQFDVFKGAEQVFQLAAGDHQQFAAGLLQSLQRVDGRRADFAMMG